MKYFFRANLLFICFLSVSCAGEPNIADLISQLPPDATKIGPVQGRGNYLEIVYSDKKTKERLAYEQTYKSGAAKLWQGYKGDVQDGDEVGWYENGKIEHLIPYSTGKINGMCVNWDSNGVELGRYNMIDGNGTKVIHYPNGALHELQEYENGVKEGACFEGFQNGRASAICRYSKGRYLGPSLTYDAGGAISLFGIFDEKGQLIGPVITFVKGKIKGVEYWLAGEKVTKERYREVSVAHPDFPSVEEDDEQYLKLIRFP